MLSELEAPRAWTLLDAPEPTGPTADVAGTWLVTFDAAARPRVAVAQFTLRLRTDDAGLTGNTESDLGEAVIEAGNVTGNLLFFRQDVRGPILFWATVDGPRMRGRGENEYGDMFEFSGRRQDQP